MTVITEGGYFEQGKWTRGLHPSMIGKKIIRTCPCSLHYGLDYSHSTEEKFGLRSGKDEYVTLINIEKDGSIVYRYEGFNKRILGEDPRTLVPEWNDGKWIEYTDRTYIGTIYAHCNLGIRSAWKWDKDKFKEDWTEMK